MSSTEKQIDFIEIMCNKLDIDNPNCKTKEEAQKWISEHYSDFKIACIDITNEFLNG